MDARTARLRAAVGATGELFYDWDARTNEVRYDGAYREVTGFDRSELEGGLDRWRSLIHPADVSGFDASIERLIATGQAAHLEYRIVRKDAEVRWVRDRGSFLENEAHEIVTMVGFVGDITDAKEAQAALHQAIEARDALLRHVHDQVLNSLQLISSLLTLQSERNLLLSPAFGAVRGRVETVASLHRGMHISGGGGVWTANYLETVCADGVRGPDVNQQVSLHTNLANMRLDSEPCLALGLITHELVTNAARHAFPAHGGRIQVSLLDESTRVLLHVEDDGVGSRGQPEGLGLSLVRALVSQLRGDVLVYSSSAGCRTTVTLPTARA